MKRHLAGLSGALFLASVSHIALAADTDANITVPIQGDTAVMGTTYVGSRHIAHNSLYASDGTELATNAGSASTKLLTVQGSATGTALNVALSGTNTLTTVSTVTSVTAIGTSVTPGTSAAHLGKAEDAAHTSGDTGVFALAVRRDTATSGGADGDYVSINVDSNGKLWTNAAVASGGIASGAIASGAVASGAIASGAFASGAIGSGAVASGAIASGAVASGAIATGAFASGSISDGADVVQGARTDSASSVVDGNASTIMGQLKNINTKAISLGNAITTLAAGTAPTNVVNIGCQYRASAPAPTDTQSLGVQCAADGSVYVTAKGGVTESDAVSTTLLSPVAYEARSSFKSAVSSADFLRPTTDLYGRTIVYPFSNPENQIQSAHMTLTSTTSSTAVTNMGASSNLFNYITGYSCSNKHASTSTRVELQDGNGGTTFWSIPVAAGYGGANVSGLMIKQPTVNTALYFKTVDSVDSVYCTFTGFRAPV